MKRSSDHLVAIVGQKHNAARQSFDQLLDAFAKGQIENIVAANAVLVSDLESLGSVIAKADWPPCLTDLIDNTRNYSRNHQNGLATWKAHLMSVVLNYDRLRNHVWFAEDDSSSLLNIDEVIEAARKEYKIDGLFDKVVEILEALVACDELDSVKARSDLERIVQLLKGAQKGTFASQVMSWEFARRFVPNLMSQYVKKSSVLGPIYEAFEQTANELNIGLASAKDEIGRNVLEAMGVGMKTSAISALKAADIPALPDFGADRAREQ